MNVLIVSPYLPHRNAGHGTAVFMDGLLRRLAARHAVTLATFYDDAEAKLLDDVRAMGVELHPVYRPKGRQQSLAGSIGLIASRAASLAKSVLTWTPYYAVKWSDGRMRELVCRLTAERRFDVVQFEMAFMAVYASSTRSGSVVLHEHDLVFRPAYRRAHGRLGGMRRLAAYADWCMWAGFERKAARAADLTLTVTEQDRRLLQRLSGAEKVRYLPRAVNVEALPPPRERDRATVLFLGSYRHQPNVDAALTIVNDIAPLVWSVDPTVRFVIAGPNPPEPVVNAGRRDQRIMVTGFVDDPDALLRTATVFLAPLRFGGGVKVKLLHAMSLGVPVVSTSIGVEGIEGIETDTTHLIGRSNEELAGCVCGLLEDTAKAARLGAAGHEAIKSNYSWHRVIERIEHAYTETLQRTA
jgi:glycosyltransferase involved in cell wall biosynthesis